MNEGTRQTKGRDAIRQNIGIAKQVGTMLSSTLGPKGMDKMLVDPQGQITVTNDGVTIMNQMQADHPAAKMLIEVANTQERELGDGTTTAVVLAGALLDKAEDLLNNDVHPSVIIKGYKQALGFALDSLKKLSIQLDDKTLDMLNKIGETAMTGKGSDDNRKLLANLCVNALHATKNVKENVLIKSYVGESIEKSDLYQCVILDKAILHPNMPKSLTNAKVALISEAFEVGSPDMDASLQVSDPAVLMQMAEQEKEQLRSRIQKLINLGVKVFVCGKGVDERVHYQLARQGIITLRRVHRDDLLALSTLTGATVVSNFEELGDDTVGLVKSIDEKKLGTDKLTFFSNPNADICTLLITGSTPQIVEEVRRAVTDAIGDLNATLQFRTYVGGAGSIEIELARSVRAIAGKEKTRASLAIKAFADALEAVPRALIRSAGLNPLDVMAELYARHSDGKLWSCLDLSSGEYTDALQLGVVEPSELKRRALSSATESACMLLRIDDLIIARGQ